MEEYVDRALAGDHQAFARLYDRYAGAALRLSTAITGNPDLAADAVQEAFLRVYRKGARFRREESFEPWFFRIVINESRRALRRQPGHSPLTGGERAASFTEETDLSIAVEQALNRLSPEHRAVLVLRFLLDRSEKEIGEILDRPVGTVKSRLHYARQALLRELEGEEET